MHAKSFVCNKTFFSVRNLQNPLTKEKNALQYRVRKEKVIKRVKEKFKNHKLTREEIDELRKAGNEDLIQYSMNLLRNSRDE